MCMWASNAELYEESVHVRDYLRFHRDFLEDFILQDIPQDTLERLLIRKSRATTGKQELIIKCIGGGGGGGGVLI